VEYWFLLSLATGLFFGLQTTLIKILSARYNQYLLLAFLFGIAAILLFPPALSGYEITDTANFLMATSISFLINIVAFSLLVYVLRTAPISRVAPFFNLTPLFITISGWLVLGETLSEKEMLGIFVIVVGCLFLQGRNLFSKKPQGSGAAAERKGVLLALFVAAIWSISATYEKVAIRASSPLTYAVWIHFLLGVAFTLISVFKSKAKIPGRLSWAQILLLSLLGIFTALMAYSQFNAIMLTTVAPVIALKRAGVVISALAGFIWFKEGSILLTSAGVLLIIYGAWILT